MTENGQRVKREGMEGKRGVSSRLLLPKRRRVCVVVVVGFVVDRSGLGGGFWSIESSTSTLPDTGTGNEVKVNFGRDAKRKAWHAGDDAFQTPSNEDEWCVWVVERRDGREEEKRLGRQVREVRIGASASSEIGRGRKGAQRRSGRPSPQVALLLLCLA